MIAGLPFFCLYTFVALINILFACTGAETEWESGANIFLGILMMIGIGVREETLYRGIVTNALALKYANSVVGIYITVFVSGVLFGSLHMYNMISGVSFTGALTQSLGAMGIGILFSAIYLRGGNIWFLIITHAIIDFSGLFESTFLVSELTEVQQMDNLPVNGAYIMVPVCIIVSVFLVRKKKQPEILDRIAKLRAELIG